MDVADFLVPLAAPGPSGVELRNDVRFHAIERKLTTVSREARLRAIEAGGSGAIDFNWDELIEEASALASEGRDLRLLVIVARAMGNRDGMDGLSKGLDLLSQTITQFWENVHPLLRDSASKQEAAMRRINALRQLENSDDGLLGDLEFTTMMNLRAIGIITGSDLAQAALNQGAFVNEAPKGLGAKETAELVAKHEALVNRVTGACRATAAERPEELAALIAGIDAGLIALSGLETALNAHVLENDIGVKFDELRRLLTRMSQPLKAARGDEAPAETPAPEAAPTVASEAAAPQTETAPQAAPAKTNGHAPPPAAFPTRLADRKEVEKCLDLIIDFYDRTEPSSPIPHLAQRMRKMVPMNFLQLMEEIAPGGIKEFRGIAGIPDEKAK